jgi:methionyl-tRNA formyltransferase
MKRSNNVTILAMAEKGYAVLKNLLPRFKENIISVIGSVDSQVYKDYYDEIKALCQDYDVHFIDKKAFDGRISTEYAIAISWRWMINVEDFKLIIFHDSFLPRYRGFNPLVSALINGDKVVGVTALFAADEYDKGDIISQSAVQIEYPVKIQDAITLVIPAYVEIAHEILSAIVRGRDFTGSEQEEKSATYSLWRDEEDYLIDWQQSSLEIKRFIDAVGFPYRGASTRFDSRLIRILDSVTTPQDVVIENRSPGKVIFIKDSKPVVVCGQGLLKITDMIDDETGQSLIPLPRFRIRFG